jgi:hypothetical protein
MSLVSDLWVKWFGKAGQDGVDAVNNNSRVLLKFAENNPQVVTGVLSACGVTQAQDPVVQVVIGMGLNAMKQGGWNGDQAILAQTVKQLILNAATKS